MEIGSAPVSTKNSPRLIFTSHGQPKEHLKNKIEQISSFHNTVRLTEQNQRQATIMENNSSMAQKQIRDMLS